LLQKIDSSRANCAQPANANLYQSQGISPINYL
jgi:hypothetical protein